MFQSFLSAFLEFLLLVYGCIYHIKHWILLLVFVKFQIVFFSFGIHLFYLTPISLLTVVKPPPLFQAKIPS